MLHPDAWPRAPLSQRKALGDELCPELARRRAARVEVQPLEAQSLRGPHVLQLVVHEEAVLRQQLPATEAL